MKPAHAMLLALVACGGELSQTDSVNPCDSGQLATLVDARNDFDASDASQAVPDAASVPDANACPERDDAGRIGPCCVPEPDHVAALVCVGGAWVEVACSSKGCLDGVCQK